MKLLTSFDRLITAAVLLRLGFFLFGLFQDLYMEVKYTDIDYMVFTDAANFLYEGKSPYLRETYRYTPILALLLTPNHFWFHFGKVLFMLCDLYTGVLIYRILKLDGRFSESRVLTMSSIWLLNPMVVTISSRGNAESFLTVVVMAFLYQLLKGELWLSGILAGFAVHFKIYPIIYIPSVLFYLSTAPSSFLPWKLVNKNSVVFAAASLASFVAVTTVMYMLFGFEFLYESYLYHLVRVDHRHNFSIYNVLLYFDSALKSSGNHALSWKVESLAFIPQLLFSAVLIPYKFSKKDLVSTFFIQTFAFVTFNKVITSQYFVWFLCFLPLFLKNSALLKADKKKGFLCLVAWVLTQGSWLYFAYKLEFLGESTFFPGLFVSSSVFFVVNVVLTGVFIEDLNKTVVKSKTE